MNRRKFCKASFAWTGLLFVPGGTKGQVLLKNGSILLKNGSLIVNNPPPASCTVARDTNTAAVNSDFGTNGVTRLAGQFQAGASTTICKAKLQGLKKLGAPTGNMSAAIWSDSGSNAPVAQIGTASTSIACNTLTTSFVDTDFVNLSGAITSGTLYWIVLVTTTIHTGTDNISWQYSDLTGKNLSFFDTGWNLLANLDFRFSLFST